MTQTYETTILVPISKARADYDGALAEVRQVYETEGASFIELDKWEERKLAYPIQGETSAVYLTGYFSAEPDAIERIERRARLSEAVLRQLIVSRKGKDYDKIREQRRLQAERAAEREKEGAERAAIRK
jgi:ribosomal protein S6